MTSSTPSSTASTCKKSGAPGERERCAALLFVHCAAALVLSLAARFLTSAGDGLPGCIVHELTGLYCLTCGATRAVCELSKLDFLRSVLLNPLPAILAAWLLYASACELAGLILGRRVRVRGERAWLIAALAVAVVFCAARNLGYIPTPEAILS